jgi:uncharacterized membrane protein
MRQGFFRALATNLLAAGIVVPVALVVSSGPAAANFRICNNTVSHVGIAIGYKGPKGWTTEGWWNMPPRTCETLLNGNLVARYYYVYAVDYDHGGQWMGRAYMCTRDKKFTIHGIRNCLARGYNRTGFFEVDTGKQRSWTVRLTNRARRGLARPVTAGGSSNAGSALSASTSPVPGALPLPATAPAAPKSRSP